MSQQYDPRQQRPVTPPQWQPERGRQHEWDSPQSYPMRQPVQQPAWQANPQGYYPPQQQWQQPQGPAPRKKRRVFLWVFLAIQVIFIIWIIAGVASNPAGPSTAAQAAQQCANGGWQGLFKSQADCQVHYAHALNEASTAGKGIGVALIVVVWIVVDFFLGLGYGIYRLASRR